MVTLVGNIVSISIVWMTDNRRTGEDSYFGLLFQMALRENDGALMELARARSKPN